jgi:outer membrane protein assembly factor BamD (BamD/ComL family)
MRTLSLLLFLCAAIPALPQDNNPAQILYDSGTRDEAAGRVERAKVTLLTMVSTYPTDPLTVKAKVEIGAIYLFLEAQSYAKAGQTHAALVTFRTVATVYPESPLTKLADEEAKSLGAPRQ